VKTEKALPLPSIHAMLWGSIVKRKPGETLEHWRQRILMSRSANIYRHQRELAMQSGCELDYSLPELRKAIMRKLGTRCPYTGELITVRNFSMDHNVPLSRGGIFWFENLRIVSQRGNEVKGKLTHGEFMRLLETLDAMDPTAKQDVLRRLRAGGKVLRGFGFGKRAEGKEGGGK
jgi:5-methylcytosine-specific restriction endonuclease McrA